MTLSEQIILRVSPEQKKRWQKEAGERDLSKWMREACDTKAHFMHPPGADAVRNLSEGVSKGIKENADGTISKDGDEAHYEMAVMPAKDEAEYDHFVARIAELQNQGLSLLQARKQAREEGL